MTQRVRRPCVLGFLERERERERETVSIQTLRGDLALSPLFQKKRGFEESGRLFRLSTRAEGFFSPGGASRRFLKLQLALQALDRTAIRPQSTLLRGGSTVFDESTISSKGLDFTLFKTLKKAPFATDSKRTFVTTGRRSADFLRALRVPLTEPTAFAFPVALAFKVWFKAVELVLYGTFFEARSGLFDRSNALFVKVSLWLFSEQRLHSFLSCLETRDRDTSLSIYCRRAREDLCDGDRDLLRKVSPLIERRNGRSVEQRGRWHFRTRSKSPNRILDTFRVGKLTERYFQSQSLPRCLPE